MVIGARSWGRDVGAEVAAEGVPPPPGLRTAGWTFVSELHVWLLAADRHSVIAQHHVAPRTSGRGPPGRWVQVRLPAPLPAQTRPQASRGGGESGLGALMRTSFCPAAAATGVPRVPPVRPRRALRPLPAQDQGPRGARGAAAHKGDRLLRVRAVQGGPGCVTSSPPHCRTSHARNACLLGVPLHARGSRRPGTTPPKAVLGT